jgi:predicted dehydrogenase
MLRVCVVGYGYWGPNLVRNLLQCPFTHAVAVCDRDPRRLAKARQNFPSVEIYADLDDTVLRQVDAVLIATPASSHYPLALRCLEAGKHVLIEKPLTRTVAEGRDLVERADRAGLVLMVDHTFVYSPAVRRIKAMVEADELGEIYYIDSVRINLGLLQHDINVIWDLAPHDLSVIDYLLGQSPHLVSASGKAHVKDQEDVALVTLNYGARLLAGVHVNWLSPVKLRQMVIGGSRKSVVFNDLDPLEKVRVYDRRIEPATDPENQHRLLFDYRVGDMWCPYVGSSEPLAAVVQHFAECIAAGRRPLTDGLAGLRVLQMLEATDRSLALGGRPVPLASPPPIVNVPIRKVA